jgi:Cys-rich protein (TIGR01571 family)
MSEPQQQGHLPYQGQPQSPGFQAPALTPQETGLSTYPTPTPMYQQTEAYRAATMPHYQGQPQFQAPALTPQETGLSTYPTPTPMYQQTEAHRAATMPIFQQPAPTTTMTMTKQETGLYPHPQQTYTQGANVMSQTWQHDLFDCSPCGTCCLATFMPSRLHGRTAYRLRDPTMQGYSTCNGDCMAFCALSCFGLGWILTMSQRTAVRTKYAIVGSTGKDCLAAWCLPCCSAIQNEEEIKLRAAASPVVQGYASPPPMNA